MGKFFVFFRIQLKIRFWLHNKRWHTSWEFQLEIRSNQKVITKKCLTNLYEMNSMCFTTFSALKIWKHSLFPSKILSKYNLIVKQFRFQMRFQILWGYFWIQFVCKCHQLLQPAGGQGNHSHTCKGLSLIQLKLLFISYKFVKGFLAITFLLLVISSRNFHDMCHFLYNQEQNFSLIRQKTKIFPIDPYYKNRRLL